jgi:hypothetical protein
MPSIESDSFRIAMMPSQPVQQTLRRFRIFPDQDFQLLNLGDLRDASKPQGVEGRVCANSSHT